MEGNIKGERKLISLDIPRKIGLEPIPGVIYAQKRKGRFFQEFEGGHMTKAKTEHSCALKLCARVYPA